MGFLLLVFGVVFLASFSYKVLMNPSKEDLAFLTFLLSFVFTDFFLHVQDIRAFLPGLTTWLLLTGVDLPSSST